MKLTPEQRYTLYSIMMQEGEDESYLAEDGFCFMISGLVWDDTGYYFHHNVFEVAPELKKEKPKKLYDDDSGLWFMGGPGGWKNRKAILRKCIEELEAKIKW